MGWDRGLRPPRDAMIRPMRDPVPGASDRPSDASGVPDRDHVRGQVLRHDRSGARLVFDGGLTRPGAFGHGRRLLGLVPDRGRARRGRVRTGLPGPPPPGDRGSSSAAKQRSLPRVLGHRPLVPHERRVRQPREQSSPRDALGARQSLPAGSDITSSRGLGISRCTEGGVAEARRRRGRPSSPQR